jgi:hypothetical protein
VDAPVTNDSYTIDRVSWHTQTPGNPETKNHIDRRFRALFDFLRRHALLKADAPLPSPEGTLPDDFELHTAHLTDLGLEVMRTSYDQWLSALDRGTPPEKVTILENALAKVRKHRA